MRCLSCERHVLFRVVLGFSREAVIAGRHVPVLDYFKTLENTHIKWETPELTPRSMKGGVATIIIDAQVPNMQKKLLVAMAKQTKKRILAEDKFGGLLDEGFIEIHEVSDAVELIEWEEYKPKAKKQCKTK